MLGILHISNCQTLCLITLVTGKSVGVKCGGPVRQELPDDTNPSVLRSVITVTVTPTAARGDRVWWREQTGLQYVVGIGTGALGMQQEDDSCRSAVISFEL